MSTLPETTEPHGKWKVGVVAALACLFTGLAQGTIYEVGPGLPLLNPIEVPWESLIAGDEVRIHWQAVPYQCKWVVDSSGTAERPIRIVGVRGPRGQLPVIDGRGAKSRSGIPFPGANRAVVRIGGSNLRPESQPAHIVLQDLEICGARPPFQFDSGTSVDGYLGMAAGVHVARGEHVLLKGLTLRNCGNGLLVSPQSSNIHVTECHLFDNGNQGSLTEHNAYTEAIGMVYEGNHFGPLRAGCSGNNLKDRSAGLVVRYNWIEGGSRQLDLVDATGNALINEDPQYQQTWVYGNVLIELERDGNNQIVHFGGDSGNLASYRNGTLYFYHNTILTHRTGATTVFRLSSANATVKCCNNIFQVSNSKGRLALMSEQGQMELGRNWLTQGWVKSVSQFKGHWEETADLLSGIHPGFQNQANGQLALVASSPCKGEALPLNAAPEHQVDRRYRCHQHTTLLENKQPRNLGAQ